MLKLDVRLQLVREYFEGRLVRVVFVKDYEGLPTPGGVINARRGDEVELPRWQARMLKEMGYVDMRDDSIDIDEVNRVHFSEVTRSGASTLVSLREDFYYQVERFVARINEMLREKVIHMLLQDKDRVQQNVKAIADARFQKIVRLAMPPQDETFKDRMTPEEIIVYTAVAETANAWDRYIKRVIEGGED